MWWFYLFKLFKKSKKQETDEPKPRTPPKALLETFIHFFQFVFALAVIGLYGQDVDAARKANTAMPANWVYAVVTGFLASVTALVYLVLHKVWKARPLAARLGARLPIFIWEMVLVILWLTLFGIFAKMYIPDADVGSKTVRMKHAVWVDVVNLVMWAVTGTWRGLRWWKGADRKYEDGFDLEKPPMDVPMPPPGVHHQ